MIERPSDSRIRLLAAAALAAVGCAVPVAPTGGPADTTPPAVVETNPGDGSTSVTATNLRVSFSEYVNESSFLRALAINPEPATRPEVSWSGRTATIAFREDLRSNTTYRITIDRELRDLNGVSLRDPIVIAFSTGPEINRGQITGVVTNAATGLPVEGVDVFAYDAPSAEDLPLIYPTSNAPEPVRPAYRTQTGRGGVFSLGYLATSDYLVVAVRDRNTNRVLDHGESAGLPSHPRIRASVAEPDSVHLTFARFDLQAPVVERARALSASRIAIQYDEPIVLETQSEATATPGWTVSDETGANRIPIRNVFIDRGSTDNIIVVIDSVATSTTLATLRVTPGFVADSSGNVADPAPILVDGSSRRDTVATRVIGVAPVPAADDSVATLARFEPIIVELNEGLRPNEWLSLRLSLSGQRTGYAWSTLDGRSYHIVPDPAAGTATFGLEIDRRRVEHPEDSAATYWYRRLRDGETGSVSVIVETDEPVVVEVAPQRDDAQPIRAVAVDAGLYTVDGLRPGPYRVRAYLDLDGSGTWTPGSLHPFRPGEPLRWIADSLVVRSRFETVHPDTVNFDSN